MCWRAGEIGSTIVSLLIALFDIAALFLILFSAANQEKYPRLAKIMFPRLVQRGKSASVKKPEEKIDRDTIE